MKLASKKSLSQRSLVCGVGVNDSNCVTAMQKNNKTFWRCPFYRKWKDMLERCYNLKHKKTHPTYVGCSVTPEWRYFSKFRLWMESQKWEGLQLDKDLLVKGNKVYGPDTCCFVPSSINNLFNSGNKKKNNLDLPEGVRLRNGKYLVNIWIKPNKRYFKTLPTLKQAHIHALEKKIEAVEYAIITYHELDIRVVFVLNREIKEMQEQINNIQNSSPNLFDIA